MNRIFLDCDGVLADFDNMMAQMNLTAEELKHTPGAFAFMNPMPGALAGVAALEALGYKLFILTSAPTSAPQAWGDKAQWVKTHLPRLLSRLIITKNKGIVGDKDDFLVDDHPDWNHCEDFPGTLIKFDAYCYGWRELVEMFKRRPKL